jgi:hypothetical protein
MKFSISFSSLDSNIPIEPILNDDLNNPNNSDVARRSTAPTIFDGNNTELVYSAPNTVKIPIRKQFPFIYFFFSG